MVLSADLLVEALEAGELLERDGHDGHVVGAGGAVVERAGGDGVGERLVQLLQPLRERLLRLLRRVLQAADPHHLLLRQRIQLPDQDLHSHALWQAGF